MKRLVYTFLENVSDNKLFSIVAEYIRPGGGGKGVSLLWPLRGYAAGQGMVFDLSVVNRVYYFVRVCQQGVACTIDLICQMNFVFTPSIQYERL